MKTLKKCNIEMNSEAFVAWTSLFSENFSDIFVSEQKELRKLAMIFRALKSELKRIEDGVDQRYSSLKRKISNENNIAALQTDHSVLPLKRATDNLGEKSEISSANSSTSTQTCCSLNLMNPALNGIKTPNCNAKERQTKTSAQSAQSNNISRKKKNTSKPDKYSPLMNANISDKSFNSSPWDTKGNKKENQSKKISIREKTSDSDKIHKLKNSPQFVYKPETVRGKARKQLPGWSCKDCEDFYEVLELSPETKKAKMVECSKHKSKFKPPDATPKGFWNLTFPTTPNTEYG